jgi:1,4-dihydroxy-2-naphthoyl-CoA hydrolase
MFPKNITVESINSFSKNTLLSHLDIEFIKLDENSITAKMPVNYKTSQPMGILHGGASVALAESIGSVGSNLLIDTKLESAVGLSINANHVGSATNGCVYGNGILIHKGKSTHVWSIEIKEQDERLISICRLTVMIIKKNK